MSDTSCILPSVTDKKREIIFEAPQATIAPSVKAMMKEAEDRMREADKAAFDLLGQPLEIDLLVKSDKVQFSMPDSGIAGPALAKSIIRAVQEYEVKAVDMTPHVRPSTQLGEGVVKYDRCVRIDWAQKTIFTNFTPNEGQAFLGAMAIIVENLQGVPGKGEPKS